jgi:hypothetical protein
MSGPFSVTAIAFACALGFACSPAISAPRHYVGRTYARSHARPLNLFSQHVNQNPPERNPQERIACTVLGCEPVPPGCSTYERTYDIVVCRQASSPSDKF